MTPAKRSLVRNRSLGLAAAGLTIATWSIAAAQELSRNFIFHEAPKPVATIQFEDANGQSRSLADFSGKVVLLNIWATWCVPCRKEMPTLDRLQATLGGSRFDVVALSIDRRIDAVRKFFAEVGIQKLAMYLDSSAKATRELGAVGLPTTLLLDSRGHEIGRLIGPAEWDSPEMAAIIGCVITRDDVAQSSLEASAISGCGERTLKAPTSESNEKDPQ